jgi:hypothetical protein
MRSRLRASERPGTELVLVPVDAPVQLDVRKAGLVDESQVEHRVAGLPWRSPPAERGEGVDGQAEVLDGHQHVDVTRVAHAGITVQGARQERSFERSVGDSSGVERGASAVPHIAGELLLLAQR